MRTRVLSVIICIISVFGVQEGWYGSATPEEVTANVIYAGTDRIVVEYTIHGFNIEQITENSTDFYKITLPGNNDQTNSRKILF